MSVGVSVAALFLLLHILGFLHILGRGRVGAWATMIDDDGNMFRPRRLADAIDRSANGSRLGHTAAHALAAVRDDRIRTRWHRPDDNSARWRVHGAPGAVGDFLRHLVHRAVRAVDAHGAVWIARVRRGERVGVFRP